MNIALIGSGGREHALCQKIYDSNITNKDDNETNKLNISIKLNKILEEMISRDPGLWIWTHNRWK